jgi:ABC-type transporter Mla maintaining outer membrane lipid asymmetry permease subunit MlaE
MCERCSPDDPVVRISFAAPGRAIPLAAGTAITADLGASKVREELDALQVLGVDTVKNLVVPRFLALMVVTGLFDIYALLFGIFGGIIAERRIQCARGRARARRG